MDLQVLRRGFFAAVMVLLIASSAAAREQGDLRHGRELFEQKCAMCHASDASGMMGMHPSLRGAV